jgi:hypothetical protein
MPMPKLLLVTAALCVGMMVACRRVPQEAQKQAAQKSAKEVVEQFYKMETEGRWLGPQHRDELADFLSNPEQWQAAQTIYVLKSYRVGDERKDARKPVSYSVEVSSDQWGAIDSFLKFSPAEEAESKTSETLYLSDKGWRMSLFPFEVPRVNVGSAMQWVVETRDRSDDPAIKYNAEKTYAILKTLSAGGPLQTEPVRSAKESPEKTADRFMRLEKGLLPEQWNELSGFFIETPKPQWNKVHVVDIVDLGADPESNVVNGASIIVSTNSLGELDASLRLRDYPSMRLPLTTPSLSACFGDDKFGFSLVLTEKHWETSKDGAVRELNGPLAWKIEETSFEPLITLDTAIRYAKQQSEKTADPVVKRNAARTLRILNAYKKGAPLLPELSSDATGGCG